MARSLKRDIPALSTRTFDLCVIGGGVTGLFVAHDAASRGLSVALLERGDFAEGTSSASTKLVHGGTRYLENYEFGLVREALRERRLLLKLAPHLTNPIPFMIPIYEGGPVSAPLIRVGMAAYDALSFDKNWSALADHRFSWHRYVSPKQAMELEPELEPKGLKGASVYTDGQMPNPMRLCVEVAKTAAGYGAVLANYARAVGLRIEGGRIVGVDALDRLTDKSFTVKAKLVVNCAGIWATEVMKLLGPNPPLQLKPSKGIHIITRAISKAHAVVSVSPSGRRVMVIPWRGKSLIGTTDDFYEGDIDRIRATVPEIQTMIDEVNAFIPSAKLSLGDVEHAYAGARPLIYTPGKAASDLSRHYQILDHAKDLNLPGMISVVGGKYTTSRSMAEAIVDRALKIIGDTAGPCVTSHLPIGGGDIGVFEAYVARSRKAAQGLVDEECLKELVHSYGTAHTEVLDLIRAEPRLGQRIVKDKPWVLAEVRYAVEHEMATSVADIALRRTDLGNMGDPGLVAGKAIAEELQAALHLSDAEKQKQLDAYKDLLAVDGLEIKQRAAN